MKKKVLVIEDEFILRRVIEQRLEKEGMETLAAADGNEGLIMALQHKPDLILLDIMMPHNGIDMLRDLRKDVEYGQGAPVIFLSNLSPDSEQIIQAIDAYKPVFYFVKANTSVEQIAEKVQEVVM